jgi:hypothetical protein
MPRITVDWPSELNEHGRTMLWFGSWIVGRDGTEGQWFYNGRGGTREQYEAPPRAIGVRIRRWPNEGFDAEYADLLSLDGLDTIAPRDLDFDTRQELSLLPPDFGQAEDRLQPATEAGT